MKTPEEFCSLALQHECPHYAGHEKGECLTCLREIFAACQREAIEEAAKVADARAAKITEEHKPFGIMSNHATYDATTIAGSIRALLPRDGR